MTWTLKANTPVEQAHQAWKLIDSDAGDGSVRFTPVISETAPVWLAEDQYLILAEPVRING